jgi:O-antigen/teichoic acid export membrane protein
MSLNRRIAMGVFAGYLARAMQIVLNLALLPIMFRQLSNEVIGIWFLLGQAALFLGLLDFGFGPTLTRRIAFAKGHTEDELSPDNRQKLGDLVVTSRVIYRWMAVAVLLLAGSTGALFLGTVTLKQLTLGQVLGAWLLFCLSYAINAWGGLWVALLSGLGYVGSANLIMVIIQVVAMIAKIIVVSLGGGLMSLAIIDCVASLVGRQVARAYLLWKEPGILSLPGSWSGGKLRSMLSPALKCWITSLGAFLILRTDEIFIGYFLDAAAIANYRAAYSAIYCLYTLALTLSLVSIPFCSQLWQSGNMALLQSVLMRNLAAGLGIMVSGLVAVLLSSPSLFNVWLGPEHFIGFPILIVFSTMLFLETQHVIFANAARSTEDEVYALWALGSGILNLALTWVLGQRFGLLGIALGTLVAQLLTNNWYCVYHGLERLQLRFTTYATQILAPLAVLALISAAPLVFILQHLPPIAPPWADWLQLMVVCLWCGGTLLVFLWLAAFNSEERFRLTMKVKAALTTG